MHAKEHTGLTAPKGSTAGTGRAPATQRSGATLAELARRLPERAPVRAQAPRPMSAKAVGSYVPRLTRPAFERYGFSAASLITDWATIVGPDLARYARPERLKWPKRIDWSGDEVSDTDRGRPGATLVLAVAAGRALDIEYKSRQIVERINAYFGYRAIAELRIVQVAEFSATSLGSAGPARAAATPPSTPRTDLAGIAEPRLRAALERMAHGLGTRAAARGSGPA